MADSAAGPQNSLPGISWTTQFIFQSKISTYKKPKQPRLYTPLRRQPRPRRHRATRRPHNAARFVRTVSRAGIRASPWDSPVRSATAAHVTAAGSRRQAARRRLRAARPARIASPAETLVSRRERPVISRSAARAKVSCDPVTDHGAWPPRIKGTDLVHLARERPCFKCGTPTPAAYRKNGRAWPTCLPCATRAARPCPCCDQPYTSAGHTAGRATTIYTHDDGRTCEPNERFTGFEIPCSGCGSPLLLAVNATMTVGGHESGMHCDACGTRWRLDQSPGRSILRTYAFQLPRHGMTALYGPRLRGLSGALVSR